MDKLTLHILRIVHRGGAWLFDRSGPLAPTLARLGSRLHDLLFPHSIVGDPQRPILLDGFQIYHDGRPSYHMQMLAMGMHDRDVSQMLKETVKSGMTVLDIGAHVGYFSLLSARLAGSGGTVWAFEPSPRLVEILGKNIRENGYGGQIHVAPAAVSNFSGRVVLYSDPDATMLSSLWRGAAGQREGLSRPDDDPEEAGELVPVEVVCTTLDAWAAEQGWPSIDLIKMDIEGSERVALEGMQELCRHNPQLTLIVELNPRTLCAAGATVAEFWAALTSCGFDQMHMTGPPLRRVEFPRDWPMIRHQIRQMGNDRVNLLCRRGSA